MTATYAEGVAHEHPSLVVVGAGIIGLATAFRLARRGHAVTLFDPDLAKGATYAAAGMIAPTAEIAPGEEANYRFQRGAIDAWREMAREIAAITHREVAIVQTGTLIVGWDASDRRLIDQFRSVATEFGAPMRALDRRDEPEPFEGLSTRITEGLLMADDGWLDPDDAVQSLMEANETLGVRLVRERVLRASSNASGVEVETDSGLTRADYGIVATGAQGLPGGLTVPKSPTVRPVRGVTVRVSSLDRSSLPTVRAYVRGRAFYMVSRPGGYCVLGATAEEKPQPLVEVGELQRLLRDGLDIVPELEAAPLLEIRNGLRPATTDLRPFFVALSEPGWSWSSGHYRHGVTLAPLAAQDALDAITPS